MQILHGPKGWTSSHRGLFPGLKTWWNLPCWVSNLFRTSDPFLASNFSVWQWACLINDCSVVVFEKQTTRFLVSQVHKRRGIFPTMDYTQSLTHTWFRRLGRWSLGPIELMIFRRDFGFWLDVIIMGWDLGGVLGWMYFAHGTEVVCGPEGGLQWLNSGRQNIFLSHNFWCLEKWPYLKRGSLQIY